MLNNEQRCNLHEIVADPYKRRSAIVTSQVPVGHWCEIVGSASGN